MRLRPHEARLGLTQFIRCAWTAPKRICRDLDLSKYGSAVRARWCAWPLRRCCAASTARKPAEQGRRADSSVPSPAPSRALASDWAWWYRSANPPQRTCLTLRICQQTPPLCQPYNIYLKEIHLRVNSLKSISLSSFAEWAFFLCCIPSGTFQPCLSWCVYLLLYSV